MKPSKKLIRSYLFTTLVSSSLTGVTSAQLTKFGNLDIVQNDAGNATTSITMTLAPGSTGGIALRSGSNRGDFEVNMAAGADINAGVLISSVSQLSRDNTAQGDTIGRFYATSQVDFNGTPSDYFIPVHTTGAGISECNINVAMAFFPYSQWIGGFARNSAGTNGAVLNQISGSTGLTLGTNLTVVPTGSGATLNTTTTGQFLLNINGFVLGSYTAPPLASQNGILLVNHAKNEGNYALSRANADGTFNIYVHDNNVNGASYEQDPIAFVYLPTSAIGTRNLVAMGRVNGNATTDIARGSFTVTKGPTGTWYLTIPGQTNATGTLIVSAEGGASLNNDNIVCYEWDGANNRWIIESRDLPTPASGLQDMGATEDVFSFAFFQAPKEAYISPSFNGATGDTVADADLGTTGNQAAITGTTAFPTITGALTTVGSLAPLFLNGGTYSESLDLGSEFLLTVTGSDSAQNVAINSLAGQAGSSLAIRGASSITFGSDNTNSVMDGPISGGPLSSLTKVGTGTISFNANNNPFTGSLTINGGGVLVDDLGLGGDFSAGLITINNGGVFTFGSNGNADFPDSTKVVINSGGRFELGQGENYGTVTLDGGEFRFYSTAKTGVNNSAVAPTAGGMAYDARSGSFTTIFSGGGTGGVLGTANVLGHFVKSTNGTVTMGNGTSFSPTMPIEIREGTLVFSGTHAVTGTAALSLGTASTTGQLRVDAGNTTISRALTTTLGGSSVESATGATLNLAGSIAGTGPLALTATGTMNFAPAVLQTQLVDVAITGNTPIGKTDLGTTVLSTANPYSGEITIQDGILAIAGSIAGSVVVGDLGSLSGEGRIGEDLDLGVSLGGRLLVDAGTNGALQVEGAVNLMGTSLVSLSGMPGGTGSISIPVLQYDTLVGFSASALELENETSYRSGSGVFTDDAENSRIIMSLETKPLVWTGASGVWDLATSENWQAEASERFYYGDAVMFNDSSANAVVTLSGALAPGSFTVDANTTNYVINGTLNDYIRGVTGLLKQGSSLLVMNAPNTYTGGTVIQQGAVETRLIDGLGGGSVTLSDTSGGGANTAFYLGGQRINFGRNIIVAAGGGTATLGSRDTITGSGDDNQFTSISLARDVIFDSNAADRTDYENITGTGNITVTGAGRTVFATTPAQFTGNVRVSTTGAGNLQIGTGSTAGNRIPDSSTVTVDAGATLRLSSAAETIAALNGAGSVVGFSPNGGTAALTVGSGNFSGVIDGLTAGNVVSLVKTGTGELILSGNNTYGGTTTISGGTLSVGNGAASGDLGYGAVSVAEGATLQYSRTGEVTQDGALNSTGAVGGASLVIGGNNTTHVTLGAAGNFNGVIAVNAGTLVFGVTNPVGSGTSAPSINLANGTVLTNGDSATHAHIGAITLSGGATITTSSGTASYNTENYQLNGDVVVTGGSTAAIITRDASRNNTNSGLSLRGTRTFQVADVTGNSATDLMISTELEPSDTNTALNVGALIKEGNGTLQLTGGIAHSYTGPTLINAGTLVADGSIVGSLTVSTGATLAPGASAGTFAAGATVINGTYACEVSGATSDRFNVTGNLQLGATSALNLQAIGSGFTESEYVIATWTGSLTGTFATVTGLPQNYALNYDETGKRVTLVATGNAYSQWATAQGLVNASATTDEDADGIANGIEFVIGGDPTGPDSDSAALLPMASLNGDYLDFTFRRTDASASFNPYVEYGSTLTGWTSAVNGVNGIIITVDDEHFGAGIDRVTVRVPKALATNDKLFVRLGVTIP